MLRIGLFLMTNIAILVIASVTMSALGVESMLMQNGVDLNLAGLLVFCAIFGVGGSFISLLMSKWLAKRAMRLHMIKEPTNDLESWLLTEVALLAKKAGIGMPEVGIIPMQESNAFATGANRNKALVAISAGMLERFEADEVRAVLGHEIGHIANGDMITLTLIQGVINAFVLFFSRVIGFIVDRVVFKTRSGVGIGYYLTTIFAQIILSILASIIVMWFSRWREYRADKAGAGLASREGMINALKRLQAETGQEEQMPDSMLAFGISAKKKSKLMALFASHPPLEDRIKTLQQA